MVTECIALVDSGQADGFAEFPGFDTLQDGVAVERDSKKWLGLFLRPEANPYENDFLVYRYVHQATPQTYDFLWHAFNIGYRFDEIDDFLQVVVVESVEFILIRVTPVNIPVIQATLEDTERFIDTAAQYLLPLSGTFNDSFGQKNAYQWTFQYAPPLDEGVLFTTDPIADPYMLSSWTKRVDGGIHNGALFFLGYKVRTSGDGNIISLSGRHWFDGSCWKPYESITR
jgi:hypothetical protein